MSDQNNVIKTTLDVLIDTQSSLIELIRKEASFLLERSHRLDMIENNKVNIATIEKDVQLTTTEKPPMTELEKQKDQDAYEIYQRFTGKARDMMRYITSAEKKFEISELVIWTGKLGHKRKLVVSFDDYWMSAIVDRAALSNENIGKLFAQFEKFIEINGNNVMISTNNEKGLDAIRALVDMI